ncbi:MAG: DUF4445 domain-containing protein [Spirochaetaceae bacterium]|nr:DUF4445 domain-containing protein [Spirochaetaceae bacterium]
MRYGFAVDIGTTNIEISLWDLDSSATSVCGDPAGEALVLRTVPLKTKNVRNCLCYYGADVVSRILYAHYNGVEVLQKKLVAQLKEEFDLMIREVHGESAPEESRSEAARAVFTGNTVMLHILSGLSVSGFEKAPFTPVSLFGGAEPAASALASLSDEVVLPPCIGAFLGADIVCASLTAENAVSGGFASGGAPGAEAGSAQGVPYIVIDIGTNTEIMLVDADGTRTACSAAAGPAFEGGGLSVEMKGSALVAELARMLDEGIMDETGYISENNADERRTTLNQQDVRQLQLAKGATAAAVETLLQSVGLDAAGIKKCFICGNFGNALDIYAVKKTGLLPAALAEKAVYAGNAALRGAELILLSKTAALRHASEIAANTVVLQLADSPVFAEKYIQRMNFVAF